MLEQVPLPAVEDARLELGALADLRDGDATNFWSSADVREKIHIVRRRADGSQSIAVFDEKTASEVHERIEIGIQSPSDVLEAEGLW